MKSTGADKSYTDALRSICERGTVKPSRVGDVRSLVGVQVRADASHKFPLLTCKFVPFGTVATELQWFAGGHTSAAWLEERGVRIWTDDADKVAERGFPQYAEGRDLGPIYGAQWRRANGHIDQLKECENGLATDPFSRRHIVCSLNVGDRHLMALQPCHYSFQFVVQPHPKDSHVGVLNCVVTMRSGDMGLGIPFNLASYALLTHLMARWVSCRADRALDLWPGEVVITIADAHIYQEHLTPKKEGCTSLSAIFDRPFCEEPTLAIPENVRTLEDFLDCDHKEFPKWIRGYKHAGALKMQLLTKDVR